MPRVDGLRLAGLVLLGMLLLIALATALFWAAVAVALLVSLAALNLVWLPRLGARLRLDATVLALLLLPLLALGGFALGAADGAAAGGLVWVLAVAVPRLALWWLGARLARLGGTRGRFIWIDARRAPPAGTLEGAACPNCGLVTLDDARRDDACPRCGWRRAARQPSGYIDGR